MTFKINTLAKNALFLKKMSDCYLEPRSYFYNTISLFCTYKNSEDYF